MGKTKVTYLTVIILLIGFLPVKAQEFGSNTINTPVKEKTSDQNKQGFKPDVRVSLGTSFSSFGAGYNSFGTYIAPEISFPVYKKFSVSVGMGYSSIFYTRPEQTMFGNNTPMQYGSMYVSGNYQVSEKLNIRGTGYKTFLLNPKAFEKQPGIPDFSNQGVALDINYKVTEHFQINASFQYRQQNYPDYYFGYPQNGFGSPANYSPFNNSYGRPGYGF